MIRAAGPIHGESHLWAFPMEGHPHPEHPPTHAWVPFTSASLLPPTRKIPRGHDAPTAGGFGESKSDCPAPASQSWVGQSPVSHSCESRSPVRLSSRVSRGVELSVGVDSLQPGGREECASRLVRGSPERKSGARRPRTKVEPVRPELRTEPGRQGGGSEDPIPVVAVLNAGVIHVRCRK